MTTQNSWREVFSVGGLAVAVLIGGTALQAMEAFITTAMLPTIVKEIGGIELFAWNTTTFVVASILATLFAANGATLALLDKNEAVHDFAASLGAGHKGWTGDVTDAGTIERVVAEVAAHFGKIDILDRKSVV